jgi:membrane protein
MTADSPVARGSRPSCLTILHRAFWRAWGRDVMLYTGGVSFFALLAVFPALALLIALYRLCFNADQATLQAERLARIIPPGAQAMIETELIRLSHAPLQAVSTQSALALAIGLYAAHRGFKALLAGLAFIHHEDEQLGFVRFNLLAAIVAVGSFALVVLISGALVTIRVIEKTAGVHMHMVWFYNEWLWAWLALSLGLTSIYRYAMSHRAPVLWPAAIVGGVVAAALSLFASWASAFYVDNVVHLSATYGSVGTVVIFLIWLSWNVNAVFFGGALATEVEIALRGGPLNPPDRPGAGLSSPRRAFRS